MSYSTNGIQTRYLEARNHSNSRTEFRLPDDIVALPSLRLINVGLFGAIGSYSDSGVSAVIKRIYLYSGSTLIDSLEDANIWSSVKATFSNNSENNYINRPLDKRRVGYSVYNTARVNIDKDDSGIVAAENDESKKGYINLGSLLPILLENGFSIDTSRMRELRVVIDYDDDVKKLVSVGLNNTYSVSQPTLLFDEVVDEVLAKQIKDSIQNINFTSIERDSVNISQGNQGSVQIFDKKFKFFDGKVVDKFLFMKQYVDTTTAYFNDASNNNLGLGVYQSNVMDNEQINFTINGKPIFERPVFSDEHRAYLCAKSWGFNNVLPYETKLSDGLDNSRRFNTVAQVNSIGSPSDDFRVGSRSYMGFKLMDRINSLQMRYQRSVPTDTNPVMPMYNQSLRLMLWAQVNKQLIIGKEGVLVRYL